MVPPPSSTIFGRGLLLMLALLDGDLGVPFLAFVRDVGTNHRHMVMLGAYFVISAFILIVFALRHIQTPGDFGPLSSGTSVSLKPNPDR
jgi:hypothetical protein